MNEAIDQTQQQPVEAQPAAPAVPAPVVEQPIAVPVPPAQPAFRLDREFINRIGEVLFHVLVVIVFPAVVTALVSTLQRYSYGSYDIAAQAILTYAMHHVYQWSQG